MAEPTNIRAEIESWVNVIPSAAIAQIVAININAEDAAGLSNFSIFPALGRYSARVNNTEIRITHPVLSVGNNCSPSSKDVVL